MPYTTSWYVPERIVLVEIHTVLTADDMNTFTPQAYEMAASGRPPVHFLVDIGTLTKVESMSGIFQALRRTPSHRNLGWMIVIGAMNPLIRSVADVVIKLTRVRYHHVDTMSEAMAFLKEKDSTLALS